MSATAVTPSPKVPETVRLLNELRRLKPEERKEISRKLAEKPPSQFEVPRTASGGIGDVLSLDDLLERLAEINSEEDRFERPGRYYASKIGKCFRQEWMREKLVMPDDGLPLTDPKSNYRFDPGNFAPGNATEDHIRYLREKVYSKGKPGAVLKDVRISKAIQVEIEGADGKVSTETIHAIAKSDDVIVGDNLEILDFTEMKSPIFWPKKKQYFMEKYGKTVPLSLIGIEEPTRTDGLVNVNNALQLCLGAQILADSGRAPRRVTLIYVNRERYREHIQILLAPPEVKFLYEFAIWWMTEHHLNLKSATPPASQFFMGYECKPTSCPFAQRCAALDKKDGRVKHIHPSMVGLNARLEAANAENQPPPLPPEPIDGMEARTIEG